MPNLNEIKQQIKALGKDANTFGTKKEIRYLPEILDATEKVMGLTSGIMNGNTWLLVLTAKRVIFLDKGMIWGLKQSEIPLEKINSIEHETGLLFGTIAIWDGAAKAVIKNVIKNTVKPFVIALNKELDRIRSTKYPTSAPVDLADQIKKLGDLKNQGLLTEDEFQAQKSKLLAS